MPHVHRLLGHSSTRDHDRLFGQNASYLTLVSQYSMSGCWHMSRRMIMVAMTVVVLVLVLLLVAMTVVVLLVRTLLQLVLVLVLVIVVMRR